MLGAGGAELLDVRRAAEHEEAHAPGELQLSHVQAASRIAELPRDRRLLVYCRSGIRSARAVPVLRRAGLDAVNVAGGFNAWRAAGLEIIE